MTENVQTQIDKLAARLDEVERDTAWLHDRRVHDINGLQGNIGDLVLRVDELERPTPPGAGDHGPSEKEKQIDHDLAESLNSLTPEPSPAPDEAAKWGKVLTAYQDKWELDHGEELSPLYTSKSAFKAAVAKAIAIGLAAPADRDGVVVTDAMVDAAMDVLGWNPLNTWRNTLTRDVLEAALRAERGEGE